MSSKAFAIRQSELRTYHALREGDFGLAKRAVDGFVPERVFDIHTHLVRDTDFDDGNRPVFSSEGLVLDAASLRKGLEAWLPGRFLRALCFGVPARGVDHPAVNSWVAAETRREEGWRFLALASPGDAPADVDRILAEPGCKGLKVYHLFAGRAESFDCGLEEFAPEWMWELLHHHRGILMLHIVRDAALADSSNQEAIGRLCRKYPGCRLVLAHVARSFSHRHAREGMRFLRDIDNAWVDTSAVCESQAMAAALEYLGPERVLFGSDYPISNFRGRSSALGGTFHWLYEDLGNPAAEALNRQMTLVGIESLTALREASEAAGLTSGDLEDIFCRNAERLLGEAPPASPPVWAEVKTRISCGTGLMSKRCEQFDPVTWPTFFSRCHGAEVWDLAGRRFVDFAGGVGAILLGYGDDTVERAVRRRLSAGTYCTLVNPEEDELAALLLQWHPWAGRIRFARGGGEAMSMAVRIARAATGRSGVAFCGYHGWQDWYLAANLGDDSALDGHLLPGLQPLGVPRELKGTSAPFFYNDFASLENALGQLNGPPAAIVMEPMRSSLPAGGFLQRVKEFAASHGAVFVLDEVTSGWRFGFPGAHVRLGLEPDIAVYAKAMSNGFPCAAVVGRPEIMDAAESSFISSSYWTDAIGTAAALACVRKIERENLSKKIWDEGEKFVSELRRVAAARPGCGLVIGGMPPCPSLAFARKDRAAVARTVLIRGLVRRGFLASSQLYLMAAHSESQREQFLQALDETLGEVEEVLEGESLPAGLIPAGAAPFARLV